MKISQIITVGIAGVAMGIMALDNVEVTDVRARQRYPWNGKVDIDFKLDSKATEPYQMKVEVYDNVGKTNLSVKSVCTEGVSVEANPCMVRTDTTRIVWDAAKDLPNGFKCTNVLVTCRDARLIPVDKLYCVINLTDGSKEYLSGVPAGGWREEHKTTKMVFRWIEAGTFMMGSLASDPNRRSNEDVHTVTLSKDYYISVFELTEGQYNTVVGGTSSNSILPKLLVWGEIRGYDWHQGSVVGGETLACNWPSSSIVDGNSLVGKIRNKTGIQTLDLPTEAQWENACRGNTILEINTGYSSCSSEHLKECCRYSENSLDGKGDTTLKWITYVGSYMPNAIGLYDMLGNVREWCLDSWQEHLGIESVIDPVGTSTINVNWNNEDSGLFSRRVTKGGGYYKTGNGRGVILSFTDDCVSIGTCRSGYRTYGKSAVRYESEYTSWTEEGCRLCFVAE